MELIVYLGLVAALAASVLPLWVIVQTRASAASDRMIQVVAARVVAARFERDLRVASAAGLAGGDCSPLLSGTAQEVVTITRTQDASGLELVEWEIVGSRLMRRRGPWPGSVPSPITHALYLDHKTMLEGLAPGSHFAYRSATATLPVPLPTEDLARVTAVGLHLEGRGETRGIPVAHIEGRVAW